MKPQNLSEQAFQAQLERWMEASPELLIDLCYPRSASGGELYLINSKKQIPMILSHGIQEGLNYQFSELTLTAFHKGIFPTRGIFNEALAQKIRNTWPVGRYYYIVNLANIFPIPLSSEGDGHTREELETDLANLLRNAQGQLIGFGEHPFDEKDWGEHYHADIVETTVFIQQRPIS